MLGPEIRVKCSGNNRLNSNGLKVITVAELSVGPEVNLTKLSSN